MVHVASEMEREGFDIPLLIGGATTSRVHTAVKIHPRYSTGQTVYVTDASRAVGVVSGCCSPRRTAGLCRRRPGRVREGRRRACAQPRRDKQRLPLAAARANAHQDRLVRLYEPPKPSFLGTKVFENYDLAELARYIDWTPFFQTWELKGRYPAILEDEKQGAAARQLCDDAQAMLKQDHRREMVPRPRRSSASGRPTPSATTSGCSPTRAAARNWRPSSRCASS